MQDKVVTHRANFSVNALEQLSSEQLVIPAVTSHVTRFHCVQLLFASDTNRLYSNNHQLHNVVRNIFIQPRVCLAYGGPHLTAL